MALGDLVEHLDQLGVLLGERGGAGAYLVGQQQFAARRGDDLGQRQVARSLVGDREVVDLLDRVAEEVHAYRVLLGGREDVDDATPYGELPAPFDQIDPDVRGTDQGGGQVTEIEVRADREADRFQVGQPFDLGLQHAPDRRHDDLRRRHAGVTGQPAEHGQPAADGVRARAQPLVRKGLPGRVVGDLVLAEQATPALR